MSSRALPNVKAIDEKTERRTADAIRDGVVQSEIARRFGVPQKHVSAIAEKYGIEHHKSKKVEKGVR